MKHFLLVVLFVLGIQSWTKADDIRDFEIEGISIGDSVLEYFSEKKIKENTWDYFKNKEFTPLQFDNPPFAKTYDAIDIQYKTEDKNYKIEGLSGIILYRDKSKIKDCYKKMDNILSEIRSLFSNLYETEKDVSPHPGTEDDGKSTVTSVYFEFQNKDAIAIQCYDYSVEAGDVNHLRISVNSYDYRIFLSQKAYN